MYSVKMIYPILKIQKQIFTEINVSRSTYAVKLYYQTMTLCKL